MVKIRLLLKALTGVLILFNVNCVNAQNISIPDANFKNALLNHSPSIDNDGNREISVSEAQAFTGTLNVSNKSISNLIGIHEFTQITALECQNNNIASLDLRGNFALTKLYCNDNSLTNLDVSKNTNLIFIYCYNNKLTNLDVSANIKLTRLLCYSNQLANLDVSANAKVTDLRCNDNQLTSLNIANGNNSSLASMQAFLNSNLTCIQTDAAIVGTNPANWTKDTKASYSANCSNTVALTNISDTNFEQALINLNIDKGTPNGSVPTANISGITTLDLVNKNISDFTGIEDFKALKKLNISGNNITTLDLSNNINLEDLSIAQASLNSIDVTKNINLVRLMLEENNLSKIDLTKNIKLHTLSLARNRFDNVDISKNTELLVFSFADNNQVKKIDVSKNTKLTDLYLQSNRITELDITKNITLKKIICNGNLLEQLDISNNTQLIDLQCQSNELKSLNTNANTALKYLNCHNNDLTSLDISKNTALVTLECYSNRLISLNVANGNNSQISTMKVQLNSELTCIKHDSNFDPTKNGNWKKDNTAYWSDDCGPAGTCNITVGIPDRNFKSILLMHGNQISGPGISVIDINGDGKIQCEEAKNYKGKINLHNRDISDLTGIEKFTALTKLDVSNNNLRKLDLSSNIALTEVICYNNKLTELDVSKSTKLSVLRCNSNQLTSLDVSANKALTELNVRINKLTSLDVSENKALTKLVLSINKLTSLDVSANTLLSELDCALNALTGLDVSVNTALIKLYCYNNKLTVLDVSKITKLSVLNCGNNQLTSLDVSANKALTRLSCRIMPLGSLNIANGNNSSIIYMDATGIGLVCIQTDANIVGTNPSGWKKDAKASYSANCNYITVTSITVSGSDIKTNGGTSQMSVSVLPANTTDSSVTWSVNNKSVATISTSGLLKAVANGTVTVTAKANDGSGVTGTKQITVSGQGSTSVAVTSITVSGSDIKTNGGTSQMSVSVLPANATDSSVTWSVNNKSVATISTSGLLKAVANGTVTVTAKANDGSGVTGTKQITVSGQGSTSVAVTSITVSGSDIKTNGGTSQMSVSVLPANATNRSVTWSVNNKSVATISTSGLLKAVANGTVTVTATANDGSGVTGTKQITVSGQGSTTVAVTSITVNGSNITTNGGTSQMSVSVLPANATDRSVTWSVNNKSIATISASGLLKAVANGTVTVTATANDGSSITGKKQIIVSGQGNPSTTRVVAPKGFSPNGDGQNDTWVVQNITNYPNNSVEIFNRWGKRVYKTTNYSNDWDGTSSSSSNKLPVGAYLYIINFNDASKKPVKGWIYLNY